MHVNVLYTFRSVSRAIPMVGGSSDPNKDALHMNTFKVRFRVTSTARRVFCIYRATAELNCLYACASIAFLQKLPGNRKSLPCDQPLVLPNWAHFHVRAGRTRNSITRSTVPTIVLYGNKALSVVSVNFTDVLVSTVVGVENCLWPHWVSPLHHCMAGQTAHWQSAQRMCFRFP